MTSKQLQQLVADLIDKHCMELSLTEYINAMEAVSSDAEGRADAARDDLKNQEG